MGRDLEPGDPARIGPYRLVGVLGSGGMGRVFLGRSAGGRPVAVKVIRADLAANREFRLRFAREVAAARKVNGLYTALVVDADVDGPVPWLATAYVAGPSLADVVASRGPLPVASLLVLAAGLAEGLDAIHAVGLVHRDLKPSNVLLADDGPRVIDFGIAQAVEATALTSTGLIVGSPGFMSPEQADGGKVSPASDVFSLGAVLTFAATGHGPFGTGSPAALIYRSVHSPPKLDDVPAGIRVLAERCLAKDPSQRPAPADILMGLGDTEPAANWLAANWLAEPTAGELPGSTPPAALTAAAPDPDPAPAPAGAQRTVTAAGPAASPSAAPVPASLPDAHSRRRHWLRRTIPLAPAAGAVVAALVIVVVALTTQSGGGRLLDFAQLQPGDCLVGSDLNLNNHSVPWPETVQAVPCAQKHIAEVYYYSSDYWHADAAFPGTQTIDGQAAAQCQKALDAYTDSPSKYTYTSVAPSTASAWSSGSRQLMCVAYDPTSKHPGGAPLYGSIKAK